MSTAPISASGCCEAHCSPQIPPKSCATSTRRSMPSCLRTASMYAAAPSSVWICAFSLSDLPQPGMSSATVRAKRPFAATRSSQSRAEPGLPCTNSTASFARGGPASTLRVLPPATVMRRSLTPGGSFGSPTSTVCSAAVAAPSGPPSPTQYWEGSGSSARAADAPTRTKAATTTGKPLPTCRTLPPPGATMRRSTPGHSRQDRDLVPVLDSRLEPVEEADVLPAHVDVHEAAQVAVDRDAVAQAVVAVVEAVEHLADRGRVLHRCFGIAARHGPQLSRDLHRDRHADRSLCTNRDGRLLDLGLERADGRI